MITTSRLIKSVMADDFIKLTKPEVTTTVIKANMNVLFEESEMIDKLWKIIEGDMRFVKIECKGKRYIQKGLEHLIKSNKPRTNRGRKPSKQTIEKRKRRDEVAVFASQITFILNLKDVVKPMTIKVFKNGAITVPGIQPLVPMKYLFTSLDVIAEVFEKELNRKITYTIEGIAMVYYKLKLEDSKLRINTEAMLADLNMLLEKNDTERVVPLTKSDDLEESAYNYEVITKDIASATFKPGKNNISIGIGYIGKKQGKKKYHTNVSIYHTGSINVTGSQKKYSIKDVLNWLSIYFNENVDKLFVFTRCKKCSFSQCKECEGKFCQVCKFCIKCKKYYLRDV